jgi:CTP:molybdopterin cytidylyltransferase MocA
MDTDGKTQRTAGIILAAGSSQRMGQDKLLLELGGESLVCRAVRVAREAGLAPILVVVRPEATLVHQQLSATQARLLTNPRHTEGLKTSLALAVARLPPSVHAAVVLLPDMPFVSAEMVRGMLRRHQDRPVPVVTSRYGDVLAPPTLFDRSVFQRLDESSTGKQVAREHSRESSTLDWPAWRLTDLDTPEDYARVRAQFDALDGAARIPVASTRAD